MAVNVATLIGTIAAIPIVGAIPTEGTFEKLSQGTAQCVLSVVAIAMGWSLVKLYKLHRQDLLDNQKEMKELITRSVQSHDAFLTSNTALTTAVGELTKTVSKCNQRQ